MVKHHVKKSKRRKKQNSGPTKEELLQKRIESGLDEFAGSSAEEEEVSLSDIHHNLEDDEEVPEIVFDEPSDNDYDENEEDEDDAIDYDDAEESSDDGEDDDEAEDKSKSNNEEDTNKVDKAVAMADVMSRILGNSSAVEDTKEPVVLSKTVTKLQRQQEKEHKEMVELRKRRRANQMEKLSAMHVPTVMNLNDDDERSHRRVATRGVVALFNAIAKHQNDANRINTNDEQEQNNTMSSKHEFLEKLKQNVLKKESTTDNVVQSKYEKLNSISLKGSESAGASEKPTGWKALKDDYLMGSNKLKDWDKGSSSEEEDTSDAIDEESSVGSHDS